MSGLAEIYNANQKTFETGTVVIFGGREEITTTNISHWYGVAGVVTENPELLLNKEAEGVIVAVQGKVKCKVKGPIGKGQCLVTSNIFGVAEGLNKDLFVPGCILGKSLGMISDDSIQLIDIFVGKS